jgi:hypothetical protein
MLDINNKVFILFACNVRKNSIGTVEELKQEKGTTPQLTV